MDGTERARGRRSFTPQFKAETVDICRRGDRSIAQVARDYGLSESTVRGWVKQADLDALRHPGESTQVPGEKRAARQKLRLRLPGLLGFSAKTRRRIDFALGNGLDARGVKVATRVRTRRRVDVALLVVGGLVVAGVAGLGAYLGDTERVTGMWVGAQVGGDGTTRIVEVIDYDFGTSSRHGIHRDVPGLNPRGLVDVSSPTAPDDVALERIGSGTRIRIGDPTRTVSGRHRYTISYPLDGLMDGRLAWDAVGTGWTVGISNVEIHVVAPFDLQAVSCVHGVPGSEAACAVAQPDPGHLVATIDHLEPGEGVTLFASDGPTLEGAPSLPAAPVGPVTDQGTGLVIPALLAGAVALLGAVAMSRLVRRVGRERVADTEAGALGTGGQMRVDREDLEALASASAEPPVGLTPAQGGILLAEAVRDEHKVAWLISAALEGYLDIEGPDTRPTLARLARSGSDGDGATPRWGTPASPTEGSAVARLLDIAFAGRTHLTLGSYRAGFARFWQSLDEELTAWRQGCGLWDPAADRRRTLARIYGGVAVLVGLALAGVGAALSNRWGSAPLAAAAAGALTVGVGWAAVLRAWELRVLTPAGSALWLQVESFRRFLAEPNTADVEEAAGRGLLRVYTPWAVAFGEADRWWGTVASSAFAASAELSRLDADSLRYSRLAPALYSSTSASSTAPSLNSGGGGGSGGGVGGGGGGGGGGSW